MPFSVSYISEHILKEVPQKTGLFFIQWQRSNTGNQRHLWSNSSTDAFASAVVLPSCLFFVLSFCFSCCFFFILYFFIAVVSIFTHAEKKCNQTDHLFSHWLCEQFTEEWKITHLCAVMSQPLDIMDCPFFLLPGYKEEVQRVTNHQSPPRTSLASEWMMDFHVVVLWCKKCADLADVLQKHLFFVHLWKQKFDMKRRFGRAVFIIRDNAGALLRLSLKNEV